jgi:hypothetical protein
MGIHRYEFEGYRPPWRLEPVVFSHLSLLVGASGVGKTRTLASLAAVCGAGRGRATGLHACRWRIEVQTERGRLTWTADTEGPASTRSFSTRISTDDDAGIELHGEQRDPPVFVQEVIEDEDGRRLVDRDVDGIRLLGSDKPIRMKGKESVVSLLQEEDVVAPLYQALGKVHRSRAASWSYIPFDHARMKRVADEVASVEALQEAALPMGQKAYVLRSKFAADFGQVVEAYREIFPTVCNIHVDARSELDVRLTEDERAASIEMLAIAIEERGVGSPILWEDMSAGMRRTLQHLLELALAPRGTVLLVDEYENSMGVNCLDAVTELLLDPKRDLQLIITSHHPYVINNVPTEHWRVVTRSGSTVRIIPASEIPALDTKSKQDAFIRLVSATEYLDGIQ